MKPDTARKDLEAICKKRKLTDDQTYKILKMWDSPGYYHRNFCSCMNYIEHYEMQNATEKNQTRMDV